jgi:hypothetical protein
LSTYRDGYRILRYIGLLVKEELPLAFFSLLAGLLIVSCVILAIPLWITYLHTHLVPRLPTAVLIVGLFVSALLSMVCGLILSTVTRARNEMKRLHYLGQSIRMIRR